MPHKLSNKLMKQVLGNYNQYQAYFPGNDRVPIIAPISRDDLVNLLNNATTNKPVAGAATDLLNLMLERDWCITAGVHAGGLGGEAGGADPEPHISLSVNQTGFHLRVSLKQRMWVLWDITGPLTAGVRRSAGKAVAARRDEPPVLNGIEQMALEFSLSDADALRAFAYQRKTLCTRPAAVAWMRST